MGASKVSSGRPGAASTGGARARARADRRQQLLDACADLVLERGLLGFTMEALGAAAGVSKALPYRHFANSEDALIALLDRELVGLRERVLAAVTPAMQGDEVLRAAIAGYFDHVAERGHLLNLLAGAGSPLPGLTAVGEWRAPRYVAQLLTRAYGVRGPKVNVLAALVTGMVTAGSDSLARKDASRSTVEQITSAAACSAARSAVGPDARG